MAYIKGDLAYIPLQRSNSHKRWFALVDADDYERVARLKWYGSPAGRTIYVQATSLEYIPAHHRGLHSFVLRVEPGQRVDHRNGNGLDNRKSNLRLASQQKNAFNTLKTDSPHVTSKFKGVHLNRDGRWVASITIDRTPRVLGLFEREDDAASAYDEAAVRLFGEFAKTNARMGLFERDAPVIDTGGFTPPAGSADGEFVRLTQCARGHDAYDESRFAPVVGLAKHHRSKRLIYRLASGKTVHIDNYGGRHPSAGELERMKAALA